MDVSGKWRFRGCSCVVVDVVFRLLVPFLDLYMSEFGKGRISNCLCFVAIVIFEQSGRSSIQGVDGLKGIFGEFESGEEN